jgi:deoxyribonuclease V
MDLKELEKIQLDCSKKVILADRFEKLELVGGMDLTFEDIKKTPTKAWASLVVLELKSLRPIYQKVVEGVVDFPYIPTFLAFREMPLMLELYKEAKVRADVYFIDGQGIAHPRGCGIASHFGVETNTPTVGVAKTILVGKDTGTTPKAWEAFRLIHYRGKVVGAVLRTKDNTAPIYVSPGHMISLNTALELVLKTSCIAYRSPPALPTTFCKR